MAQFKFLKWLVEWYYSCENFSFEWDSANSTKSVQKHNVDIVNIESVFNLKSAVPIGIQVNTQIFFELRFCIIGPDLRGETLFIIFTIRNGKVRQISSRLANKKERILYENLRQTIKNVR